MGELTAESVREALKPIYERMWLEHPGTWATTETGMRCVAIVRLSHIVEMQQGDIALLLEATAGTPEARDGVAYSGAAHIARDIREGRFPQRSEPTDEDVRR